jgi:RNA polymerase sigma factor for flagellar operon FliA
VEEETMSTSILNPVPSHLVVQNYFNLVNAIAAKIKRRLPGHVDVEDLVQTGMIGLLEAASRFDPSRAVEFSTYANARITGVILDELRKSDACSRQDRRAARVIESAKAQLRIETREEPGREQIAEAVGLGLAEYDRTLHRLEAGKSPEAAFADDSEMTDMVSQLPSKDESALETYCKRENSRLLRTYIDQLTPRQREVLNLYYFENMALREIGDRLGVGESRISQIHKQACIELRRMIDANKRPSAPKISSRVQ